MRKTLIALFAIVPIGFWDGYGWRAQAVQVCG
jgi:hypothetical protein